nr:PHP domain-containing protein [uncultured Lachnoclostridium sp.]
MNNFFCYHLHTEDSLLDSCTNHKLYTDRAAELGQKAIGFSEHGNIYNWIEKKMYANSKGLKYVHECEVYLTESLYHYPDINMPDEWYKAHLGCNPEETQKELDELLESEKYKVRDNYHTILIAKNYEGFKELNLLIDKSTQPDHFYYKPRITFDEFFAISDNIIKISACLASPLSKYPSSENADRKTYDKLLKAYDYYEIQPHIKSLSQIEYNQMLYEASKQYNKPLIAGTDTHSLNKYKAECRSILQKAKKIAYADEDAFDLTYKSYDELVEMFRQQGSLPMDVVLEAIENTNKVADMVEDFELDTKFKYPVLYDNEEAVFKKRINDMYQDKIKRGIIKPDPRYKQMVREEMRVFKKIGMVGFMLFMSELVCWCWENDIPVGFCRGSVGGSMIAYLTDIIDVNPLVWNTIFSRFANESRKEIGDIDLDIAPSQRHLVYEHIIDEYGVDKTAYVLAMGTISDKGTIDEIGRALSDKWASNKADYIREYEELQSKKYKVGEWELGLIQSTRYNELKNSNEDPYSLDNIARIKKEYEENPEDTKKKYPDIFYYFDGLVNTTISQSMHPAGIIVSPVTLPDNYGTFWNDGKRILTINMEEIHEVSLVKYDLLGLKNIEIIKDTCELAHIPYPKSYTVNWDDQNVWNHIADSPVGIFQFESKFAFDSLKKFHCHQVNDLSLVNASIRPSGESYRDRLLAHEPNKNPSELIDELLAGNHGYLVFQEDVIAFLQNICGLSGSEADNVRRAIGRKQMDRLQAALPQILEGYCNKSSKPRGEAEKEAKTFLQIIEDSSNYMFGYNHSTGYSMLGYMCGYLRYYYPREFITAYLNNANNDNDITMGTQLAETMNIKIHPIKFRHSIAKYSCDKSGIYKGIGSIKFLNDKVGDELYNLKDDKFDTFVDLLVKLKGLSINSRQLDILIKLDFFEEFGDINYLLKQVELFEKIYGKKQFSKEKLSKLNIPLEIAEKYAEKITDKMLRGLDTNGLLKELIGYYVKYTHTTLKEHFKYENECLGYITTIYPLANKRYYYVTNINITKSLTTVSLYEIYSGKTRSIKMWTSQYNKSPFEKNSILYIHTIEKKNKREPNGEINPATGKKIYVPVPDKFEYWLSKYIIKNDIEEGE